MNAQQAIQSTMETSAMILKSYISDLSDADLLQRPGPGCNHLAWQLGHLIASECSLLEMIRPGTTVSLPDGFVEQHGKETTGEDDPAKFCSKEQYLELFDKVQAATTAALESCSDEDLDQPSPEQFREMFPTVGSIFILLATHPMMHAGQFVPVRRALDKPILI